MVKLPKHSVPNRFHVQDRLISLATLIWENRYIRNMSLMKVRVREKFSRWKELFIHGWTWARRVGGVEDHLQPVWRGKYSALIELFPSYSSSHWSIMFRMGTRASPTRSWASCWGPWARIPASRSLLRWSGEMIWKTWMSKSNLSFPCHICLFLVKWMRMTQELLTSRWLISSWFIEIGFNWAGICHFDEEKNCRLWWLRWHWGSFQSVWYKEWWVHNKVQKKIKLSKHFQFYWCWGADECDGDAG